MGYLGMGEGFPGLLLNTNNRVHVQFGWTHMMYNHSFVFFRTEEWKTSARIHSLRGGLGGDTTCQRQ